MISRPARARLATAVAAVACLALTLAACTKSSTTQAAGNTTTETKSSAVATPTPTPTPSPTPTAVPAAPVHVQLLNSDGSVYGVGMPIVAYFSVNITDAKPFVKATTVKVNGVANAGTWYFEKSGRADQGYPMEAHFRPAAAAGAANPYWPAHAAITMDMPTKGISAGAGLAYDDSLTLTMATGAANLATVDCSTERMTVTSDGTPAHGDIKTSCGKASDATYSGVKVVMQKGEDAPGTDKLRPNGEVRMVGTGYDEIVGWSVRVTQSGEYVHAAQWNGANIGERSTSHGCTNLNPADAQWYYNFAQIGDVVNYVNTGGDTMPYWDGFGDWNLSQAIWNAGGLLPTT